MGQMRFLVSHRQRVPPDAVERAYLASIEGVVWPSDNRLPDDHLVIQRKNSDSGNFFIPWQVPGHGELVLSTASLMEREIPYHLEVELARGTLNRVRNQLLAWESAGLTPSEEIKNQIAQATLVFSQAVAYQADAKRAAKDAEIVISTSLDALNRLADEFTQQVLSIRHRQTPKLATLFACGLEVADLTEEESQAFLPAFNAAVVPFSWREIEPVAGQTQWNPVDHVVQWCRNNDLKVCSGPLLQLSKENLPDWIYLWEDDFEELQSYVVKFIEASVQRYRGSIDIWQCESAVNVGGALSLSEEQRLRLAVSAIDAVRRVDPQSPAIACFDQPWGEFLRTQDLDLTPLHFADALVRADLGLAGIGLEINLGYWPNGTLPRDLLEISRLIDQWGLLGLPLIIFLSIPSSAEEDKLAQNPLKPLNSSAPDGLSPTSQQQIVERLVPFLVAKQAVHGVVWNQFRDAEKHRLAHAGLFDFERKPKPVLQTLTDFRQKHLT